MLYTAQPLPLKCAPLAAAKSAAPAPASAAATSAAPRLARAAAPAAAATASQRHSRDGREHRLDHAPHARRGGGNLDARGGAWQQPHPRDGFRTFNDARGARERGGGRGGYGDRRDGYSAWQQQVRATFFYFVRSSLCFLPLRLHFSARSLAAAAAAAARWDAERAWSRWAGSRALA